MQRRFSCLFPITAANFKGEFSRRSAFVFAAGILFRVFPHTHGVNTFEEFKNERFNESVQKNAETMKKILPSEDVLVYTFTTDGGVSCAIVYADGMVNKQLLGDLVARPLTALKDSALTVETVKRTALFPEVKIAATPVAAAREILDGNALLLCDGVDCGVIAGAKLVPVRAITEPQTSIAVKGPREGFIEDVKTNMALVRKRLKTGNLRFEALHVGKQTDTSVALCYLNGIANEDVLNALKKRLGEIDTDVIIDSSYVAAFIAPRRYTLFRETGTTEKPDIFCAKIAEGRIGILVDGSPIALTVPYLLTEDFQSADDYFISPFAATIFRFLRFFAAAIALLLPAFYVGSQLFKIQLIPLNLTLTIAGSIRGLPLSPSLEMFLVLLVLEILKEASIRMPKYVGLALSVVGALVLGEAAVSAGFVSTPAIIIVAFSGICLYTVPEFVETGSVLRWLFLIAAGSMGPFGVVLFIAFLLYYLTTADAFGAPPLAPFAPLIKRDMKDSLLKADAYSLALRPAVLKPKNRRRLSSLPLSAASGESKNSAKNGKNGENEQNGKNGQDGQERQDGQEEKPSGIINDAQKITEKVETESPDGSGGSEGSERSEGSESAAQKGKETAERTGKTTAEQGEKKR